MPVDPATTATQRPPLANVLADVLGELAFMVADDQAAAASAAPVCLRGRIRYRGPVTGTITLGCTREFAVRLAANLLGIEPEDGSATLAAEDAVREFLNVICGQLVTAWHGREAVFNLEIPVVTECAGLPDLPAVAEQNRCHFAVDGEPLCCAVELES